MNVGLCIALKDIISIGDSIILPGDGASHTEVHFQYIVFRPKVSDIITGKIRSCSREGVHGTGIIHQAFDITIQRTKSIMNFRLQ